MYISAVGLDDSCGSLPTRDTLWFYDFTFYVLKSVRKKEIQTNHALPFIRTASHKGLPGDNKNIV